MNSLTGLLSSSYRRLDLRVQGCIRLRREIARKGLERIFDLHTVGVRKNKQPRMCNSHIQAFSFVPLVNMG